MCYILNNIDKYYFSEYYKEYNEHRSYFVLEDNVMKKNERIGIMIKLLSDSPCKLFSLKYFCDLFGAAKSSISEDLHAVGDMLSKMELGFIETIPGANGGIRFIPNISTEKIRELQSGLCEKLSEKNRLLGGGFLYTSDIMCDAKYISPVATTFAKLFHNAGADYVATIETKGIPVATLTAQMLNLPLVVIRREAKISEGSTVSINYFSGSYDRVQKMSIAKRAVVEGSKAIIIDDFMRGGGSIKGIAEILSEFNVQIIATGVIIAVNSPEKKKISNYVPIIYMDELDKENNSIVFSPNKEII